jgi:type VI secretion system secreted protein Hcp
MKAFRNNRRLHVLVITLVLGAVAAVGGVGLPRTEAPAAVLAAGPDAIAAAQSFFDVFLEIEGIDGEATVPAHKGTIEVLSWSWGISQAAGVGTVSVIKRIDKATPLLFEQCIDGTVIPLATVYLTRQDGQTYLQYELRNVIVSSISHGGDVNGDGLPDETLELTFGGATLTYTQFDAAGKPVGQTTGAF